MLHKFYYWKGNTNCIYVSGNPKYLKILTSKFHRMDYVTNKYNLALLALDDKTWSYVNPDNIDDFIECNLGEITQKEFLNRWLRTMKNVNCSF